EIRQAKAQLLSSLNVTHPNSTLTSSSSTNHLRRSLQALPFPPTDERIATYRTDESNGKRAKAKGKEDAQLLERRRKVEHWVPAIWIPDQKTNECMRCVCASCSGRTFFISDSHTQDNSSKPARACDTCYETVFPLIDPVPDATPEKTGAIHQQDTDRFPSLSSLPSWLSVPSFPGTSTPRSLMAIEREPSPSISYVQDFSAYDQSGNHRRIKPRLQSTRVRSYNQLLENFEQNDHGRSDVMDSRLEEENDSKENGCSDTDDDDLDCQSSSRVSINGQASSPRKEDTVRRHERFSSPAVALHATNVTARTSAVFDDDDLTEDGASSPIKTNKRFSLVLGGRHRENSGMRGQSEVTVQSGDSRSGAAGTKSELVKSIAAGKLSEILARKKE
ncbi:FYVE, RhoGEF and PH domain-containing protein 6, partial [Termitomyces sp. T112]